MGYRTLAVGAVTALLASAAIGTASAAPAPSDPVSDAVSGLVHEGGFPAAVAYYRDGDTVRHLSAGVADLQTGRPATPDLRWRIASNTKAFVATVVLQLAGSGALSLDDPVSRWLPGLLDAPGYEPSRITLRSLLNHTSGLHDPDDPNFFKPYFDGDRGYVYTPSEVIRRSLTTGPRFAPGQGVEYTNTGYLVLGKVIERVTGDSVVDQISRRLLRPLGLTHTSFPLTSPFLTGPHLHGYDLQRVDMTTFSPSYDWTAGAMISTVDDLATFHRALLSGRLLKPAQQAELTSVVPEPGTPVGYGAGVETMTLPCPSGPQTFWGNTGAGPGFYSVSVLSADGRRQLTIVLTMYDLAKDVQDQQAVPTVPLVPLSHVLCR